MNFSQNTYALSGSEVFAEMKWLTWNVAADRMKMAISSIPTDAATVADTVTIRIPQGGNTS